MQYISKYQSPLGVIFMTADEEGLTGLWLEGQKYCPTDIYKQPEENCRPVFETAKKWLDIYFSGREPDFKVPIHFSGTDFQLEVWRLLCLIPYGETVTYGFLAQQLAKTRGISRMSARAVGAAVGKNKISIIVPCHRVIGSDKSLTGYAGGIDKKAKLLKLEGVSIC